MGSIKTEHEWLSDIVEGRTSVRLRSPTQIEIVQEDGTRHLLLYRATNDNFLWYPLFPEGDTLDAVEVLDEYLMKVMHGDRLLVALPRIWSEEIKLL